MIWIHMVATLPLLNHIFRRYEMCAFGVIFWLNWHETLLNISRSKVNPKLNMLWFTVGSFELPWFSLQKGAKRFIAPVVSSKISTHFIESPTIGLCETDELAEIVGFFNKLDSAFGPKKGVGTHGDRTSKKLHPKSIKDWTVHICNHWCVNLSLPSLPRWVIWDLSSLLCLNVRLYWRCFGMFVPSLS